MGPKYPAPHCARANPPKPNAGLRVGSPCYQTETSRVWCRHPPPKTHPPGNPRDCPKFRKKIPTEVKTRKANHPKTLPLLCQQCAATNAPPTPSHISQHTPQAGGRANTHYQQAASRREPANTQGNRQGQHTLRAGGGATPGAHSCTNSKKTQDQNKAGFTFGQ